VTTAVTQGPAPTREQPALAQHSNAYDLFILVLTILSLGVMVCVFLPLSEETLTVLQFYDNLICVIFLIDFTVNITRANPKRAYWIDRRGWLDLIGSIPTLGIFRIAALLRLARLSRLERVSRMLKGSARQALIDDVIRNRGQYAIFITLLTMVVVLTVSSVLILQFEHKAPDANIVTGGDALWWGIVTITTVGYGDYYPVTGLGRTTGVVVMFAGVGIIGALASILASILVPSSKTDGPDPIQTSMENELAGVRQELAAIRELLSGDKAKPTLDGGDVTAPTT
jgi:voltage-gated potassium channel